MLLCIWFPSESAFLILNLLSLGVVPEVPILPVAVHKLTGTVMGGGGQKYVLEGLFQNVELSIKQEART